MAKLALLLSLLLLPSCLAGPHQLRRSVEDLDRSMYVEQPWLDAVLWVVPVVPALMLGARVIDFAVGDAYAFWFDDAWSDEGGTGFRHADVPAQRYMNSLMPDFMSIQLDRDLIDRLQEERERNEERARARRDATPEST